MDALGDGPRMLRAQMLRDKQIDHVFSALIDDRGNRFVIDVIEASAKKRKAFRGQIDHWRRNIDPAVEPRFHGVPIAGFDIHQLGRAHV